MYFLSNEVILTMSLACLSCGREYDSEEPWRCECGGALDDAETPLPAGGPPSPDRVDTRLGLWAFEDFLPVSRRVSLGEGFTPEVRADEWNARFKLEYVTPSASFKDRGATTMLSRALELGVNTIVDDSSGNAGSAVALYGARAGLDVEIYVPASAPEAKRRAIEAVGASTIPVEGTRQDVTEACIEAVAAGDAWYASHCWRPSFLTGTKTLAFEIAHRRGWESPDAVVVPLGVGTLFLGAYRGFCDLVECGWIDEIPRLLGAQAAGFAPVASTLHGPTAGENALADGLHSESPPREAELLEAIEATDGDAIAVTEPETRETLDRLNRSGFYVEPSASVAPAALAAFEATGAIDADDDVVVALSGSGLNA